MVIEKILKDIYAFYKCSPKRQNTLMSEAKALIEDALNTLKATMDKSIEKGTLIIYIILILRAKMT